MKRRDLLKAAATAAAATPLVSGETLIATVAAPTAVPKFLTRAQYALVDELTEILIPADEHSGGARAAGVAAYIDQRLAEAIEPEPKQRFVAGLTRVDQLAHEAKGTGFLSLSAGGSRSHRHEDGRRGRGAEVRGREVLRPAEATHRPWLLHIENRHPRRDGVQGQRSAGGVLGIDVSKPGA